MRIYKTVSLDVLLGMLIAAIPVMVFVLNISRNNPFIDGATTFVVLLISLFLLLVIWLNRRLSIPLLEIFIIIFLVFWHLRFVTLSLFPGGELVLSRTVAVDHELMNTYAWMVFLSVVTTVVGILLAHAVFQTMKQSLHQKEDAKDSLLNLAIKQNVNSVLAYCLLALSFQIYSTQMPAELLPGWLGYLGFLFPFSLVMLLSVLVLLNKEVSALYRSVFLVYILSYVALSVLAGSRSILLHFVLSGLMLMAILNIKPRIRFSQLILIILLGTAMLASFGYGTFQRHMRSLYGYNASTESTQYVIERMSNLAEWDGILGMAFARAGYLDFSAEMFANPKYGEVVTSENIVKGVIDAYVPGAIFEDSRLVEQRIRDVYNPTAEGYQSDAIGVVGENFLLFGSLFPLAIVFVAFVFTGLFYSATGGIFGTYFKFTLAVGFMAWWNSFGYDWLLLDVGRQLIFGWVAIVLVFRFRDVFSRLFGIRMR